MTFLYLFVLLLLLYYSFSEDNDPMVIHDHPLVGCKDALQILKYFSFIINVFLHNVSLLLCLYYSCFIQIFTFPMVLSTTWFLILPPLDQTLTLPVGFAAYI